MRWASWMRWFIFQFCTGVRCNSSNSRCKDFWAADFLRFTRISLKKIYWLKIWLGVSLNWRDLSKVHISEANLLFTTSCYALSECERSQHHHIVIRLHTHTRTRQWSASQPCVVNCIGIWLQPTQKVWLGLHRHTHWLTLQGPGRPGSEPELVFWLWCGHHCAALLSDSKFTLSFLLFTFSRCFHCFYIALLSCLFWHNMPKECGHVNCCY